MNRHIVLATWMSLFPLAADAGEPYRCSLAEAVSRAKDVSPRVAALQARERAAEAGVREADAGHWPSLDVTAGYARNSDVPEFTSSSAGGDPIVIVPNLPNNTRFRASTTVPLFSGFRTVALGESARAHERAAGYEAVAGREDVVLETTVAYWALVTAREKEKVLAKALEAYESHLKDARNRHRSGLAAKNEVLQVQVERDGALLAQIEAGNQTAVARANLLRILDLPAGTDVETTEPLDAARGGDPDETSLVAEAMERRAERKSAQAAVRAAESLVRAERSGFFPQLSAGAGWDYANPNRKIFPPSDQFDSTWDVSVNLSANLFEGGRTRAAIDRRAALADAERMRLREIEQRIGLDVAERVSEARTALAGIPVAERSVEAGRENVEVSRNRYRAGVSPSSELLDAEAAELHAGLAKLGAWARLRIAQARLERAVGR
jgi:outer membrane protein TolC